MNGTILVAYLYPLTDPDRKVRVEFGVSTVANVIHDLGLLVPRARMRRWYLTNWFLNGRRCTPNTVIEDKGSILIHTPIIYAEACGGCRACRARRGHRG